MKILIIDNNVERPWWGSENLRRFARRVAGATVHTRRGPQDDLPTDPSGFDRIVISGSKTGATEDAPWVDHLHELIRRAVDLGKPVLGVCYGHQSLARALGGKQAVRRGERGEFGWTKIAHFGANPLFKGLGESFYSYSSHYDEVCALPPGTTLFARSEICPIQGMQVDGKPVFGIQFHPEKNLEEAEELIEEHRRKKKMHLLLSTDRKRYDPKVGETIFGNFFAL